MRQKVTQRLLQMVRTAAKKAKATRSGTTVQSSTRRLQSLGKKKREEKKQKKEMSAMLAVEIRRDSENLNIRNRIFEVRTKAPKTVAVKASFSCSAWGASCPAGWFGNMKFGREKTFPPCLINADSQLGYKHLYKPTSAHAHKEMLLCHKYGVKTICPSTWLTWHPHHTLYSLFGLHVFHVHDALLPKQIWAKTEMMQQQHHIVNIFEKSNTTVLCYAVFKILINKHWTNSYLALGPEATVHKQQVGIDVLARVYSALN